MLFLLSLVLILIDAFIILLLRGWLEEFDRGWRKYSVSHLRAQERERRLQELERWRIHDIVALLPILIQGSLFLFCIGLIMLHFPLHLPSAILCLISFVSVVVFYGFTLYVPIFNNYSPFSSPVSRLLGHGLWILRSWRYSIARNTQHITTFAIQFLSRLLPHRHGQQTDVGSSHGTTQSLPSINAVAKPMQAHKPGTKSIKVVRSDIDPWLYVHVLERLASTTAEAAENIPIFLELLDQPVKNPTLRPSNVRKWKLLLRTTLGLLRDQSTLSVSAAWTLARTMMVCYSRETADEKLCLTLQYHLGRWETYDQGPRMPLNALFSSYFSSWLDHSYQHELWRTIAFLGPSDAADAELLWMVNTFHRAMQSKIEVHGHREFFVAVLTYISSTEQSSRSEVPLTVAVLYAMHTMISALERGGIDRLFILPGTVSTSGPMYMTFHPVADIAVLDLWSEECIQIVMSLLQGGWGSYLHHDFQLSLIAALYIDSTKRAYARSTFADLLQYTRVTHIRLQNPDAYDHGKLAGYWYMALSQTPLDQDRDPIATPYDVIENVITEYSTLQLPGLHILEVAVKHVHNTTPRSSDWLQRVPFGLRIIAPDKQYRHPLTDVDPWVLLHLDTLLAPEPYFLPEEAKGLEWSDTPAKVHIAKARLNLYDSPASAERDGANRPKPDPELLRVFLWSKDIEICTESFKWSVRLAPVSQPGSPGDRGDSTGVFIPETMGYEWVEHFVHVLCNVGDEDGVRSWLFLKSHLVPERTGLPPSWWRDFASAFLFSIVRPRGGNGRPAYQVIDESIRSIAIDERQEYLSFLATMLEFIKPSSSGDIVTLIENWLGQLPGILENHNAPTQLEHIVAARRQQIVEEETLGLFAELAMADEWMNG